MTKPEVDPSNVLPISLEDLDEEQCREIEQHLKETQEALLARCFIKTRQGAIRQTSFTSKNTINVRIDAFMSCKFSSNMTDLPPNSVASTSQGPVHQIFSKTDGATMQLTRGENPNFPAGLTGGSYTGVGRSNCTASRSDRQPYGRSDRTPYTGQAGPTTPLSIATINPQVPPHIPNAYNDSNRGYPEDVRVPEFTKFSGKDNMTTWEYIGQFSAQWGEASNRDAFKLRLFSLSLSGTAFTWFTSLPVNSIHTWAQLEQKFHDYFYTGKTELRLCHLTSVRQKYNESVIDYIKRFRDVRNRCFSLNIIDRDLANLAFNGLLAPIIEILDGQQLLDVSHLMQKALAQESRVRESKKFFRSNDKKPNASIVDCPEYSDSDNDDGDHDIYIAEWSWTNKNKPFICST
uniref:Gag protein n=2 Tax=Oryza sativa subsp. japonica TaxID=39947 RepID=A0A5S6R8K7_ORYSJ|nr:putative gag protein [Oryza sativa Japonica Group]AAO37834.1 putative gag protein [Oryza sativa Japonica Group]ABF97095.1 retrotransposon protein, putative, unclassified [Oryza sativa Japonica Group]